MKKEFDISGMNCAACAARIERVTRKIEGIESASVNLAAERLVVSGDGAAMAAVTSAVERAGFGITPHKKGPPKADKNLQRVRALRRRLIGAAALALPLFYLAMGPMIGLWLPDFIAPALHPLRYGLVQMGLALAVMIIGRKFYTVGYSALFRGAPNMDSLIAIGTTAAFGYSLYSLWRIAQGDAHAVHQLYFESCGVIITLILLGKTLETIAKGKSSEAISKMATLVPKTCFVIRDGAELEVPTSKLRSDDLLILKPGSRIPCDGIVVGGHSVVDESMLTGESLPIEKNENDRIYAGSINLSGALTASVSEIGEETVLGEMIRMVEQAQGSKPPIARLADVVSGYFVPIVMAIAFIAAACWKWSGESWGFALSILVSVLVIACPCALGLATPTAIMVGIGKAAENGILFKSGEAVEQLHAVDTIVLDKTGTLTMGKPQLTDLIPAEGFTKDTLLALLAAAERGSEHPTAKAILAAAQEMELSLEQAEQFESIAGRGIRAVVGKKLILAGNRRMMEENDISFSAIEAAAEQPENEGKTPIFIAVDGQAAGIAAVADALKPDSAAAVAQLRAQGIQVVMLTGDSRKTAEAIAKEAGIDSVYAEVLPAQKAEWIQAFQKDGARVAMVGDGINDGPALALADVGIAIGSGTDIAMESADVVLMGEGLSGVSCAMELSRRIIRNIRQNLFWAFGYNVLGIPAAAGLLYLFGGPLLNPMIGAAAMSLSSVSVVTNALRLKGGKINGVKGKRNDVHALRKQRKG